MIDISACDIVFISYDEPNAERHFAALQTLAPRALRVHGVKGFDAAHRRAGEIARSNHVLTVDGDNLVTDAVFLAGAFDVAPRDLAQVFSFSARNVLNGLQYGNGGAKLWPRRLLLSLRTHERAARPEGAVDFWTVPFYLVNRPISDLEVTGSPSQAFRAGFREGVKLNMIGGRLAYDAFPDLPRAQALRRHIGAANHERLRVWCMVGADVENGDWAMLGARLGCVRTALEGFDVGAIADFDWSAAYWRDEVAPAYSNDEVRRQALATLACRLNDGLSLDLLSLGPTESAAFKANFRNRRRYGPLPPA
jgi:hypothetical protein